MKKHIILAVAFLMFNSILGFAQAKVIEHKVIKGDNVTSIARKYNVSASDIYKLNPEAIQGVKLDAIIKVPIGKAVNTTPKKHVVEAGENFYSISRKYNISPADLKLANKTVDSETLKTGTVLVIPSKTVSVPTISNATVNVVSVNPIKNFYHTVVAKETKFGIAKHYGLSMDELDELNPEIRNTDHVEVGTVLRLSNSVPVYKALKATTHLSDYTIEPDDTLYSLSRKANLTEEEFLKINPNLKDGVIIGHIIKMPTSTAFNKVSSDLTQSLTKFSTKNLVLLLPFNTDKVGVNKEVTIQDQLKNDKFLNMTLDFYAGALVAIDSAKKMGLPLKVQVLDSKESRTSSSLLALHNKGSFNKVDAVVGPFFQNNVESLSGILANQQTVIVSPMSTEKGKPLANLYQSMPSAEDVKKTMIDYMQAKNGNIIAIIDPKKGSMRKYISESFPNVKLATVKENSTIEVAQFKELLDRKRLNFVILETESVNLALNATKSLVTLINDYQIQLVTLDKSDILESEEIELANLMKLKLMYPSVTRDTTSFEPSIFAKTYKNYNGVLPNKFAIRGFDVTFDTILRLFNISGYKTTVEKLASEQIENKFNYINIDGAYYNKGVYLMYYDSDLTIKEAN